MKMEVEMLKWLENLTTQKLILIAFVVIVLLLIFNPPVAERVWQMVREMTGRFLDLLSVGEAL